ncbi:uncharacterized protein LOC144608778 isoform X2 [Rhinoraja longicauda]
MTRGFSSCCYEAFSLIMIGPSFHRQEPLRSQVYQPLPWKVQNVSRNRRSSRVDEDGGSRRSSVNSWKGSTARGVRGSEENIFAEFSPERAAVTIQTHYRRYQECKKYEQNP